MLVLKSAAIANTTMEFTDVKEMLLALFGT